ncbi:MAG: Ig-like domain-containing protein [Clostridia bacterium]|nr:Ig-like domain-containing protein [Clostridia bacterium]
MKKLFAILLAVILCVCAISLYGCDNGAANDENGTSVNESADKSSGGSGTSVGIPAWDGNGVTYTAEHISKFGSGTPYGYANYYADEDVAAIWNTDTSLDNYGGVQTPMLYLDFSKAVTFKMQVVGCYSQYIVKLAVEGENEYYYVLSDESKAGEISVNVVDSMLSEKYKQRNTQPDPGYHSGWKYDGQKKNCSFHILAKGPDGESQTAELKVRKISVFNNEVAVTGVTIASSAMSGKKLSALKGSAGVLLTATVAPSSISDKSVIWESLDSSVATVDDKGNVNFVGVGKTHIVATSATDQSKSDDVEINVLSGYEDTAALKAKLSSLATGASAETAETFKDLFKTSWADEDAMTQSVALSSSRSARMRSEGNAYYVFDHFDGGNANEVSEAAANADGDKAYLTLTLASSSGAEIYRLKNGELTKAAGNGSMKMEYLEKSGGAWQRTASYDEYVIVVGTDGNVKKAKISVISCDELADFAAADFADSSLWTVPDRTKQAEDRVAHALSPASVKVEGNVAVLKQNKYPEAKYCFGGIIGNITSAKGDVEIVLDVKELNKMNDYVKTMWEIKIVYYEATANGYKVVSSNPIKLASGNEAKEYDFTFKPAYEYFRLYLVVNGSDIGAQFADAEMKIAGMKVYALDS